MPFVVSEGGSLVSVGAFESVAHTGLLSEDGQLLLCCWEAIDS